MEKVTIWYVENIDGNGETVYRYFKTYYQAAEYAAYTLGKIGVLKR